MSDTFIKGLEIARAGVVHRIVSRQDSVVVMFSHACMTCSQSLSDGTLSVVPQVSFPRLCFLRYKTFILNVGFFPILFLILSICCEHGQVISVLSFRLCSSSSFTLSSQVMLLALQFLLVV